MTFNSSLIEELRSIAFVTKLLEEGWFEGRVPIELRHMLMHSIGADEALRASASQASSTPSTLTEGVCRDGCG